MSLPVQSREFHRVAVSCNRNAAQQGNVLQAQSTVEPGSRRRALMDALSAFLMADEPADPALSYRSADEAPAPVLCVPVRERTPKDASSGVVPRW